MTALPPTPGMEITFFYQASQLFAECMTTFMKQCIREHFKSGAQAHLVTIQNTYLTMHPKATRDDAKAWDVSFLLHLWHTDALLRPSPADMAQAAVRADEAMSVEDVDDDTQSTDDEHATAVANPIPARGVRVKSYQPKIFALSSAFADDVFARQKFNRILSVETGGQQVWVLHSGHYYNFKGIRNVRNRWAHGQAVSVADYFSVIDTMYSLVRSLPNHCVTPAHHNQFNYLIVNMRQLVDAAAERERLQQEKERLTQAQARAQSEKEALQAEMDTAQQRIAQLAETLAELQTVQHQATTRHDDQQAEQQVLVQALLRHFTNTTYHTNTTIDTLQDQVQRMQQTDRDDLLLATIVQLQQVVVEQRQTIAALQHNLVVLDQGLHQMARTKPIDPATVPVFTPGHDDNVTDQPPPPPPPMPALSVRWQAIWMLVLTATTAMLLWAWGTGLVAQWWAIWAG